ncbi:MAG: hypothetical protein ACI4U4_01380 [Bacilli bacterium]
MDGIIRLLYSFKFSVFGIELDSGNLIGSVQKLTNFSSVQSINIWSIGKAVNDVIVPIALSLLILFFMINLIKKAMEVERISWERIAMSFVSFLLLKYFIQNGYTFLSTIMNIVNDIFVSVTNVISNSNSSINIADTLINAVPDGFIDSIMTYRIVFNIIHSIYDNNCSNSNTDIFKSSKTNIMFCICTNTNCTCC